MDRFSKYRIALRYFCDYQKFCVPACRADPGKNSYRGSCWFGPSPAGPEIQCCHGLDPAIQAPLGQNQALAPSSCEIHTKHRDTSDTTRPRAYRTSGAPGWPGQVRPWRFSGEYPRGSRAPSAACSTANTRKSQNPISEHPQLCYSYFWFPPARRSGVRALPATSSPDSSQLSGENSPRQGEKFGINEKSFFRLVNP